MSTFIPIRKLFAYTIVALCLIFITFMAAQALAQTEAQDEEVQMGQEVFNELKAKGEII
jgi:uncharacterized membrane protein